ncbi:PREDICTED: uncharacterized protein LOC18587437 isoform X2 [Theobroma cacao]|uniref:Uncharacterized protein LOC18587437 isoform X2 n=1 Tax=Theobroma cacao TaxID=3641 RepID=A0AB32WZP5_THECC|nr:PREDICTED: uncharacterized protein LOC18587437 isoform X2 [Theobroma cacao]
MLLTSEKRNKKNEDRMGKLPDAVLLKIMSFLNTKQAVQTCVLSKRWKSLWQSLPNLDFNFDTFPFQQEIDDEDEERVEMKMASFSNFISQVLFRRCPTDLVKVEIYAPQLTTFKYSGIAPTMWRTDSLANLDDVYFDIKTPRFKHNERDYVLCLINILNKFRHAKSLTLSTAAVKVLTKFPSLVDRNRLRFTNLKHLKIKFDKWPCKWLEMPACMLNCFLNSSTILKICMDSPMAVFESPEDSD